MKNIFKINTMTQNVQQSLELDIPNFLCVFYFFIVRWNLLFLML